MSLLDRGNTDVILYPEEMVIDPDGNKKTQPSATGIPLRVLIQPVPQSGTSARRAEQDNEGFESETVYRMRLLKKDTDMQIGMQARIEWNGEYWSIMGEPTRYFSSNRTKHTDITIRRS